MPTENRTCVVVADAVRARIFFLESRDAPDLRKAYDLVEKADLVNPGRRLRPSQTLSDTRPGTRRAAAGGTEHAVDDRRDAQQAEDDRRFAGDIAAQVDKVCAPFSCTQIILTAPPSMLAHLREREILLRRNDRGLTTAALELTKLTPTELHDHLAGQDLLPDRWRPRPDGC